jgi:hypothetical protein
MTPPAITAEFNDISDVSSSFASTIVDRCINTMARHNNPLKFIVESRDVNYTDSAIESRYIYRTSKVVSGAGTDGVPKVIPTERVYHFRTDTSVPRVG